MAKIFIIEDDANILAAMEAKFGLTGLEVIGYNGLGNIEEVENKIELEKPDFIILDLILPHFDGFSLLQRIKAKPELSGLTVFIFTNLSDQASRSRGNELGAEFYFIKSEMNIDIFVDRVSQIIKNKLKTS